ncbi:MAG TPA: TolC family protein [Pyrinomonadaceae bacterium]|nr:TolC family protein [Pyrinomonadaceae bacterium]
MKGSITTLIACLMTSVLFGQSIAFAQQVTPSIPQAPVVESNNARHAQQSVPSRATRGAELRMEELIEQALENNPEIKSMQRRFDMIRARIPQAKALDQPMLTIGYMGNIAPFQIQKGDPSSGRMIMVSQDLPFPGKRSLRGKRASSDADAEWWRFEQARRNVVAEVKDAYFELYYLTKAIEVITKTKILLEQFTKIAEARYAVGKGIQQDVLKAQVEFSKLLEKQAMLEQHKQITEARINSLLYRESDSLLGKPEELSPREFAYTLGQLNETAIANHPDLKAQRRRIEGAQYGIQLAKKEYYPDFSVGFTYVNRPAMPDMYGVNIGIKLPIYRAQKLRPALTEATASFEAEKRSLENTTTLLMFKIRDRYLAETTAQRLVKLYSTTIVPQSSLSLESAIAGYEVGKVDFLTLLDNLVTLLNYELNYYEQLSNEEKAVAALEPLVGIVLRP